MVAKPQTPQEYLRASDWDERGDSLRLLRNDHDFHSFLHCCQSQNRANDALFLRRSPSVPPGDSDPDFHKITN